MFPSPTPASGDAFAFDEPQSRATHGSFLWYFEAQDNQTLST